MSKKQAKCPLLVFLHFNFIIMRKLTINQLREYPEYSNLPDDAQDERKHSFLSDHVKLELDPILALIYAPDPVTGIPRSDVALEYSSDVSDELHQYIRSVLQQPRQSSSAGDDPDLALASIKDLRESNEEYFNRLREICNPVNQ